MRRIFLTVVVATMLILLSLSAVVIAQVDTAFHVLSSSGAVRISAIANSNIARDTANRSSEEKKIESAILELLVVANSNGGSLVGLVQPPGGFPVWAKIDNVGKIYVNLYVGPGFKAQSGIDSLESLLPGVLPTAFDFRIKIIPVWLSPDQVKIVSKWKNIKHIGLVTESYRQAAPVSQGVARIRADFARNIWPNATGDGIKVGIISDDCGSGGLGGAITIGSEHFLQDFCASGKLPAIGNVDVVDDNYRIRTAGDRSHEGLAMMQIVHDVAPGSLLAFATAGENVTSMAANIYKLAEGSTGHSPCKVITDDYTFFTEPFFEDGAIANAIEDVTRNDHVTYITSAGNWAQDVHTFQFSAMNQSFSQNGQSGGYTVHDFNGNNDPMNRFYLPPNGYIDIALQWDDDFQSPQNVFNLMVVDPSSNQILYRTSTTGIALEEIIYRNGDNFGKNLAIVVTGPSTPFPHRTPTLKLAFYCSNRNFHPIYHNGNGSVLGHAMATSALSCGAVNAQSSNYNQIEPMSSRGPIVLSNGRQRLKPDFVSMDGVSTSVPSFPVFYGTSAAAPHAAGIAALAWGMSSSLNTDKVRKALVVGCINYGAGGSEGSYGAGRTDAFRTISALDITLRANTAAAYLRDPPSYPSDNHIISRLRVSKSLTITNTSKIYVAITLDGHDGNRNLSMTLTSPLGATTKTIHLMDRVASPLWGANPNIVFGDAATQSIQTPVANNGGVTLGFFRPAEFLDGATGFHGNSNGEWLLEITYTGPRPILKDWGIYIIQ